VLDIQIPTKKGVHSCCHIHIIKINKPDWNVGTAAISVYTMWQQK